ncbi:hypothetical protein P153DRAFT_324991 [Dothidotthia symphoricarpi CBS 119687]|uniref:Uncharacterized protein n=1 Tax=Dothidotthia symphoricarpi CBS 119687 TaxID=1392245 RepID=A0A6A6A0N0_9PLEO|nr:uncharacterized protein P153DRAFT_324991 [Dothidotthia symphoricarpi CBS 119687]KAF2125552.1 hypothetical protein P153DRAFT_324991 [Dothidotthia symphoricarpi CBS 119687]
MGGLAFANFTSGSGKPVQVPRISPGLYNEIAVECQSRLEALFHRVLIPREAPGKVDHGDIDILVEGIRPTATSDCEISVAIKDALGAELHLPRGDSHSYAIPHPDLPDAYVQVDVELSPGNDTPEAAGLFEWIKFMKGDSDLLQIIGVTHRPLGLVCNDKGLHVRVEEIEPYHKKKALVFLTRDPNQAMDFYGLDKAKYWAGFENEADLFNWVSKGRLFSWEVFDSRTEKANDRSRQNKRPMYRRFVEEYMPAHPDKGVGKSWTRQQVLQEALTTFDKRDEYDAMMEEHFLKEADEGLWKDIRAILPIQGNTSTRLTLQGLRRWVIFEDGEPRISSKPILEDNTMWAKVVTPESKDDVLNWVKQHWVEVKALEKARSNAAKEAAKTG